MRIGERRLLAKREQRWSRSFNANDPFIKQLQQEEVVDNRRAVRIGILAGIVLHIVLFVITFPEMAEKIRTVGRGAKVYHLQQVRFQPPKPQVRRRAPRPKAKRIPIPDPTPDDPEPIYDEDVNIQQVDFPDADVQGVLTIPEGLYPEEARQARIQGVVILQTIIDTLGEVKNVRVLKGLPSGLTEAAIEAVTQWRFNPATLEGEPVAVYYMVTITFSVQ
jgi:TonB family protein